MSGHRLLVQRQRDLKKMGICFVYMEISEFKEEEISCYNFKISFTFLTSYLHLYTLSIVRKGVFSKC